MCWSSRYGRIVVRLCEIATVREGCGKIMEITFIFSVVVERSRRRRKEEIESVCVEGLRRALSVFVCVVCVGRRGVSFIQR